MASTQFNVIRHPTKRPPARRGKTAPERHADVQQNLQRLDRLANLGLFSASIAHEIKNGLVAVNTFCQVLLEKDENREMAEMVRRELKRIDGLVTQMLRLAAPKPATLAPVNIHDLLDATLGLLEHQMSDRMIALRRDYQADPATVQRRRIAPAAGVHQPAAERGRSHGPGGRTDGATESGAGQVRIAIRDTGAGIAPENFGHIFDTFFTTKKHGTGLGLAISRRMVEEHHGDD